MHNAYLKLVEDTNRKLLNENPTDNQLIELVKRAGADCYIAGHSEEEAKKSALFYGKVKQEFYKTFLLGYKEAMDNDREGGLHKSGVSDSFVKELQ